VFSEFANLNIDDYLFVINYSTLG